MVEAASHFDFVRGDTEVKATQVDVFRSAAAKPRRDVRFVGPLVRAKSRVPIDTEDSLCGIGYVIGRKPSQLCVERRYQFEHRCFDMLIEKVLAGLEPLSPIVALEAPEKLNHFLRKTSKGGGRQRLLLYNLTRCLS